MRRDQGYADKLRKHRILLEGSEVGLLAEGDVSRLDIGTGSHELEARVDWCGSRPLALDVAVEDEVVIARSVLRGWNVVLALWYTIFNRRGYYLLSSCSSASPANPGMQRTAPRAATDTGGHLSEVKWSKPCPKSWRSTGWRCWSSSTTSPTACRPVRAW